MSIYGGDENEFIDYIDAGDEKAVKQVRDLSVFLRNKMFIPNFRETIEELKQKEDKKLITVWAEESGPLRDGSSEYAFGNGASGLAHGNCGYTMLCGGRVLRMGLCSVTRDGFATDEIKVGVSINGTPDVNGILTKPTGQRSAYTIFQTPIELGSGSVLNFVSFTTYKEASISIVNVLIELDI